MKEFKLLDCLVQLLLITAVIISYFLDDPETINPLVLILSFGVVQVISIVAHFFTGPQAWKLIKWRKVHLVLTGIILLLVTIAFLSDSLSLGEEAAIEILLLISIPAIIISLFYTLITFIEWRRMKQD